MQLINKEKENWFKRNKELIEFFMVLFTLLMVIATFYQAYQSKRAIDLQFTPFLDIEISSNKMVPLTGNLIVNYTNYENRNHFVFYRNDLKFYITSEEKRVNLSTIIVPIAIKINNLGDRTAKIEQIKYNFSCNPNGEVNLPLDNWKSKIIIARESIYEDSTLYLDFGKIPDSNKSCSIKIKFIFNNIEKELDYTSEYNNFEMKFVKTMIVNGEAIMIQD